MNTKSMDLLNKALIFAAGVAIGSVVTWRYFTAMRDGEFQDESIEEELSDDEKSPSKKMLAEGELFLEGLASGRKAALDNDVDMASAIIKKYNYAAYSKGEEEKEEEKDMNKPYVIPPEDFGDADYKVKSLVLYSDGVLVTESGIPIEDIDGTVGKDSLNHFGEFEADSVFVRNDCLETDFEILLDSRKYNDVMED